MFKIIFEGLGIPMRLISGTSRTSGLPSDEENQVGNARNRSSQSPTAVRSVNLVQPRPEIAIQPNGQGSQTNSDSPSIVGPVQIPVEIEVEGHNTENEDSEDTLVEGIDNDDNGI